MLASETVAPALHTASPERASQIAGQWIEAFNRKDLDALLALYDPEAVHVSPNLAKMVPETQGRIQGHEALREWWEDCFVRLPTLRYTLRQLIFHADRMVMMYLREVTGENAKIVEEIFHIRDRIVYSQVLETEFLL